MCARGKKGSLCPGVQGRDSTRGAGVSLKSAVEPMQPPYAMGKKVRGGPATRSFQKAVAPLCPPGKLLPA